VVFQVQALQDLRPQRRSPAASSASAAGGRGRCEGGSGGRESGPFRKVYQPGHPQADASGIVNYPNVDPVEEMTNMIAASRAYQFNVEVMNTSRQLLQRTLEIGR
jgi:flagellar basal-body rod protein FlgC